MNAILYITFITTCEVLIRGVKIVYKVGGTEISFAHELGDILKLICRQIGW